MPEADAKKHTTWLEVYAVFRSLGGRIDPNEGSLDKICPTFKQCYISFVSRSRRLLKTMISEDSREAMD